MATTSDLIKALPRGITVEDRHLTGKRGATGKRWAIRVRDPGAGRYVTELWDDADLAAGIEWAHDERARLRLGLTRSGPRVTLADIRGLWLQELERLGRSEAYRRDVKAVLVSAEESGCKDVTGDHFRARVRRWLKGLGCEAATANNRLGMLRTALRYAMEEGRIQADPLAGMRRVEDPSRGRIPRLYTPDQLRAILGHQGPLRLPMAVMTYTGMRLGEVAAMRWSWLDWQGGVIRIRQEADWSPKRHQERDVPILDELRALLQPGAKVSRRHVFPALAAVGRPRCSQLVIEHLDAAGIEREKGQAAHRLRHTWISYRISLGRDLYRVKTEAGHSTVKTTERYAQIVPEGWLAGWPRGGEFWLQREPPAGEAVAQPG